MRLRVLILVILLVFSTIFFAEESTAPTPVLEKGDVMKFIKTFPLMKEDFEKFNVEYEAKSGNINYPDVLRANKEFQEILKKHGWDENFFSKMTAIIMGYSSIVYKKEIKNADPQLAKSMKEIKDNPNLSAEMKKQLLEQLKSVKGVLKTQSDSMSNIVSPVDLDLVKPHIDALKEVFEESKKK